jgi:hypothetical protein
MYSNNDLNFMHFFDLNNQREIAKFKCSNSIQSISFSCDGGKAIAGGGSGELPPFFSPVHLREFR